MRKFTQLTMLVVAMFGLSFSSFAQATDIFISEYAEGSSNHKYLELYNATGATVDLSNYEIWRISNGGSWPEYTTSLSGMLADGEVIVIANSGADTAITNLSNATTAFTSATYFNGDDAMGLAKDDGNGTFVLIDVVGTHGADPGAGWDVNGTTDATANHTMVRHDSVCSPDTNWTTAVNTQWDVYASNTWTYAGSHTSTCAAPVSSDTTKPEVISGDFASSTMVTVSFSEPVTSATAQDINNYVFTPALTVSSAVLSASEDSVTLTIAAPGFVSGSMYNVTISNVTDTSGNANVMDPFNADFYFNSYAGSDLMITEIYHSQPSSGIQDIDYFELHNSGAAAINLAGMELTSGVDFYIDSNLSIPAGGYLVFVENIDSFNLAFATVTNVIQYDGGSLSGGGETITLSNTLGDDVASVSYQTSAPWPAYSNTEAIEVCDVTTDYTNADNWYYSGNVSSIIRGDIYGTPGVASMCATPPTIYTYDIEVLRTVDANGEPDSIDVYCKIEGIVVGKDMDGNAGYTFVLTDDTRGITVHSFVDVDNYVAVQGDELRCVGAVKFYNGLTQFRVDSITVLSTGNCIDFPLPVFELGEETESEPIKLFGLQFVDPSAWPAPGSNANMDIVNTNGDTLLMRIDKDTKINDTILTAPTGIFNLSGVGSQFDGSSPYDEGYQIMPQFVADFDTVPSTVSDLFINEVMVDNQTVIADPQGDYDSWVEIYNNNSTPADLTGLYIASDDTVYQFPRCQSPVMVPANGFVMLWADGEMSDGAEHLSLTLSNEDYLGLFSKDATVIDTTEWDSSLTDVSYGRSIDGAGTWVSFEKSTPNETNTNGWVLSVVNASAVNALEAYPNPISNGSINFNKVISFDIYSITGQIVTSQANVNSFDISNLNSGVYVIKTTDGEILRMVVK